MRRAVSSSACRRRPSPLAWSIGCLRHAPSPRCSATSPRAPTDSSRWSNPMPEDSGWAAYLDEVRAEAAEHLRALDTLLLQLERDPGDPRAVREMFLSAHTIKGGAAMLELASVRELAHALEDVLGVLRDQPEGFDSALADLLFRALDALRALLEHATPGGAGLGNGDAALAASLR